jgi:hypothetical protein
MTGGGLSSYHIELDRHSVVDRDGFKLGL